MIMQIPHVLSKLILSVFLLMRGIPVEHLRREPDFLDNLIHRARTDPF